jgi:hypothetical protein
METGELLELAIQAEVRPTEAVIEVLNRTRRTQRLLLGMLKKYRRFG